jgi:hypothetical protein
VSDERHNDRDGDEQPLDHAADHDEWRRRRHAAAQMVQAVDAESDDECYCGPTENLGAVFASWRNLIDHRGSPSLMQVGEENLPAQPPLYYYDA